MKRPLLRVALLFIAGILIADQLILPVSALLAGGVALAGIALLWGKARLICLPALVLVVGAADLTLHTAALSPYDLRSVLGIEPQLASIRGVLIETPTVRMFEQDRQPFWRTLARVAVADIGIDKQPWRPAAGIVAVSTPGPLTNLFAGQEIEISGVVMPPKAPLAEGIFDYRAYLRQQGIWYQLQANNEQDWKIIRSPAAPPVADRFRTWARQALSRGLPFEDESLRLEWALTLGWKPALTEEVSEPFVQAATYHIFAVDGLRMAILFGIFFGLFRVVGLPRPICGLILIPLIWFYVALTGWPASAIRASVMLTIVIGGWVLKRPSDLINSLLAAAIIILLWQPRQLFQAGFQLSFVVVLCLILMLPTLFEVVRRLTAPDPWLAPSLRRRWPAWLLAPTRYLGDLSLTSLAAWVGSIPLVAYYFNIVTPVSFPANVIAVPLCGLVLIGNSISLLLAGWFPVGAELFNHAGWFLMECIRVSSHWFAGWPKAYSYVPVPSLFTTFLYYALLLGFVTGWLQRPAFRPLKFASLMGVVLLWGWNEYQVGSVKRLTILPLNGGTAIYFDDRGQANDLLIDCGATNSVRWLTKSFLRAQGVKVLPGLVLTHGDIRHMGGADILAMLFAPQHVYFSPVRFRSAVYRKCVKLFDASPGLVRRLSQSDQLGSWQVLHPQTTDHFPQADDNSLVLLGTFDSTRILLLPDLGRAGQEALLGRTLNLRADVVIAGLPTNGESLREELLQAIEPKVIVLSDSELPASGRASSAIRERLAQYPARTIYTRSAGAVTIELRRDTWRIRTCCQD